MKKAKVHHVEVLKESTQPSDILDKPSIIFEEIQELRFVLSTVKNLTNELNVKLNPLLMKDITMATPLEDTRNLPVLVKDLRNLNNQGTIISDTLKDILGNLAI